ncbi:hypothetical protein ACWZXV_004808, partial [Shigella sonnei]
GYRLVFQFPIRELAASEKRLREMERYVTSDTFTLRSRFRQL